MRQPLKLIIKKGKVHRDGTSLIFLQYCYSKTEQVLLFRKEVAGLYDVVTTDFTYADTRNVELPWKYLISDGI